MIPVGPAFTDDLSNELYRYRNITEMWGVSELDRKEWGKLYGYITRIEDSISKLLNYMEERNWADSSQGGCDESAFAISNHDYVAM